MIKLSVEEAELLASSKDAMELAIKILESLYAHHRDKLVTESIEDGNVTKLIILKSRADGMRAMINEFRHKAIKNNRS